MSWREEVEGIEARRARAAEMGGAEAIAKQHDLFQHGIDMEAFKRHLEEGGVVREQGGEAVLTKRGERMLRQDSLDAIFGAFFRREEI